MKLKKYAAVISALLMVSAMTMTGCSKKNDSSDSKANNSSASASESSENSEEGTTQPDPLAPKNESSARDNTVATEAPSDGTSDSSQQDESSSDDGSANDTESDQLIADAQALFESACETHWNFHVGCPYELDYNTYIENNFGWQFFLITNSNINSIADVEADYHKVFSDAYTNDLSEIYMEQNGRVYALDGARGSNIFYQSSQVTAITKRTDNEIFFTVNNNYSGDDFNPDTAYTKTAEFSVVIDEDGSWKAGKFSLPY